MRITRVTVMASLALFACNGPRTDSSSSAGPAPSGSASTPVVEGVPVISKPLDTTTQLEGELAPYERVAVFARANGFVSQVLVDRGSRVKQGQLLVAIVAPELGAQRAEAQAKLQGDKSTFDRLKAASQTPGAVAGHDVEIAEAAMQTDQARVDSLR